MLYALSANLLALLHLVFISFVLLGGLLSLFWGWMPWLHLPAVIWGAIIEYRRWTCPLTPLEQKLRHASGGPTYSGSFIGHYFRFLIYPAPKMINIPVLLGSFVVVINVLVYGWIFTRFML